MQIIYYQVSSMSTGLVRDIPLATKQGKCTHSLSLICDKVAAVSSTRTLPICKNPQFSSVMSHTALEPVLTQDLEKSCKSWLRVQ